MKRSILPSKKFPFTNSHIIIFSIFSAVAALSMGIHGCRVRNEIQLPALLRPVGPLTFTSGQGAAKPNQLGSLQRSACNSTIQYWDINFTSAFGRHVLKLEIDTAKDSGNSKIDIDGSSYLLQLKPWLSPTAMQTACDKERKGDDPVQLAAADLDQFKQSLSTALPDCQWRWSDEGWQCQLNKANPQSALAEMKELETHIIIKWSRHPYLLTRRIALVVQMAGILSTAEPDRYLSRFCKALAYSLPTELPLALRSPIWQTKVCNSPSKERIDAALVGLQQSIAEVEALKEQMETTSRIGSLTVRIPPNQVPSRDLWVSLDPVVPHDDEDEGDAARAEKIAKLKAANQSPVCWHPLYGADVASTRIALALDAIHKSQSCQPLTPTDAKQMPQAYIVSSITSEAEFPITNGRSKVLRLPEGDYRYTLRKHVPDFEILYTNPKSETTSGTLEWDTRRPQALIEKW